MDDADSGSERMLTAHIPAGYAAARLGRVTRTAPFWALVFASIFPDFDLIWFYLIDDRAFHHHRYWVHIPGFWLAVAVVTLPVIGLLRPSLLPVALAFLAGIALHLILDTIAGSIAWAWRFSDQLFVLVTVPPTRSHFILSFLTHWTFALEILVWIIAAILWRANRRAKSAVTG